MQRTKLQLCENKPSDQWEKTVLPGIDTKGRFPTSLTPPPRVREQMPPMYAVPLRLLWKVRPLGERRGKHSGIGAELLRAVFHINTHAPTTYSVSFQPSPSLPSTHHSLSFPLPRDRNTYERRCATSLCSFMFSFLYFMKSRRVSRGSSPTETMFCDDHVSMATRTILVFSCSL